jgi:hypothetical protein
MSAENPGGIRCYRHPRPDTLLGRKDDTLDLRPGMQPALAIASM